MWPYANMQYSVWYERIVVLTIMILLGVAVITAIWLEESESVSKQQIPLEARVRILEEKIEAYDRAMESQVRINQYMLDFQEQMMDTRVLALKREE